jgi:hypothetical protein
MLPEPVRREFHSLLIPVFVDSFFSGTGFPMDFPKLTFSRT